MSPITRSLLALACLLTTALIAAGFVGSPALAKCGKDCKQLIATEFKKCKSACPRRRADKACRKACRHEKKSKEKACKAATSPTSPGCGRLTTTTTTLVTARRTTVFLILMENTDWSSIKGSSSAPYINRTLLPIASHAEQYYNPPNNHPSLPNYLWLEDGTNFGILDDNLPSQNHQSTTSHLVDLLEAAGISWKTYQEDEGSGAFDGTYCPIVNEGNFYDVNHYQFVYFDDVTQNNNPQAPRCIQHVRP